MKTSKALLTFDIVTLMPEMFSAICDYGITRKAFKENIVNLNLWNPREFSTDLHKTVDDRTYGGGPGMIMMADPLVKSIEAAKKGSFGSDSNPANSSRNINGVHCHTSTIITVTFDKASLLNQRGVTPNKLKKSFTGPSDSWKTVFQITVIITGVVIIGIKKRTRKNL